MFGVTERGRLDLNPVRSFNDYKKKYGGRTAAAQDMYDAARAFFEEGGSTLYIGNVYGDAAVEATGNLGTMLVLRAKGGGTWGNAVVVSTEAPTGLGLTDGVILTVEDPDGTIVETSYPVITVADAIAWVNTYSNYVSATAGSGGVDATMTQPATVTLTTGAAGAAVDDANYTTAVELFDADMGPGQFYAPGPGLSSAILDVIVENVLATQRTGIWDLPDTNDPTTIATALDAMYVREGSNMMLGVGPMVSYPHETAPATIFVPAGGVEAGMVARVDQLSDRSLVAAGSDGISRRALGLKYSFGDADRQELNALGAALFKVVNNSVRMYGYRTSAGPTNNNWMFFQESRVIMQLAYDLDAMMEEFVLKTIDGRKILQTKINVAGTGICTRYWEQNALYGETATDAFRINTDGVNNVQTAMAGEVHMQAKVKTSRVAEWVNINLVKTMLDRPF